MKEEQVETETKSKVRASHRATLKCKYLGNTGRISVERYESTSLGKDPNRVMYAWEYALNPIENYEEAVRQYVTRAGWDGEWVVSTITDGAVAVWVGSLS